MNELKRLNHRLCVYMYICAKFATYYVKKMRATIRVVKSSAKHCNQKKTSI